MSSQDEGMESYDEDDTMIQKEGELHNATDDSSSCSNALKLRPRRTKLTKTKPNHKRTYCSTNNNSKTSKNNNYHSSNELNYSNKTSTPKRSIHSTNKHTIKSHCITKKPTKHIHRNVSIPTRKRPSTKCVKQQSTSTQRKKLRNNASVKSQNENRNKNCEYNCECNANTWLRIFCCSCFCTACVAISIVILVTGVNWLQKGNKYESESTKQLCYLTDYESKTCNCADTDEGQCSGYLYKYSATVTDKCGDMVLMNDYDIIDGNCKGNDVPKDLNKEYECYVMNCNDEKFTFVHHSDYVKRGVIYIVLGCVFLLCPIGAIILYLVECLYRD